MQDVILEIQIDHFGKQCWDAFFLLLKHRFALKPTGTAQGSWSHFTLIPTSRVPTCPSIPQAHRALPGPPAPDNRPKERFPGGSALAQENTQHDSLETPGLTTMEPLLAAFHGSRFAEANALPYTTSTFTDREKIEPSLRKAAFFIICCFTICLQAATVFNWYVKIKKKYKRDKISNPSKETFIENSRVWCVCLSLLPRWTVCCATKTCNISTSAVCVFNQVNIWFSIS